MVVKHNNKGRDFVVGDIHGRYHELLRELETLSFDEEADRLFSVGDIIDRGPDSSACLSLLITNWFFAVLGNHEDLLVQGKESVQHEICHLENGGRWTIEHSNGTLDYFRRLITKKMPLYITLDCGNGKTLGICHAEPPTTNWKDMDALSPREKEQAIWGRRRIKGIGIPTRNVTATVHGHTPTKDVVQVHNSYFIDTAAVTGKLTILNVQDLVKD